MGNGTKPQLFCQGLTLRGENCAVVTKKKMVLKYLSSERDTSLDI